MRERTVLVEDMKCEKCGAEFAAGTAVDDPLDVHDDGDPKPVRCPVCVDKWLSANIGALVPK